MKKIQKVFTTAFAVIALITLSGSVNAQTAAAKPGEWKEMEEFHEIMAKTFHPSEDGNLDPIKNKISVFVERAAAWKKSTPPKEYNKPGVVKNIGLLNDGALALEKKIKEKASDEVIKADLAKLHDVFHDIVGECRKSSDHEGHNHDGHSHDDAPKSVEPQTETPKQ